MNLISKKFDELTKEELYKILKARAKIFVAEQNICYLDMDDIDYNSLPCFFMEEGQVIAYLRAFYEDDSKKAARIGRVLTVEHGKGIGKTLLSESLKVIKNKMNCTKICGHSQKHALTFYEQFGFKAVSGEFLEEGIINVAIEKDVINNTNIITN